MWQQLDAWLHYLHITLQVGGSGQTAKQNPLLLHYHNITFFFFFFLSETHNNEKNRAVEKDRKPYDICQSTRYPSEPHFFNHHYYLLLINAHAHKNGLGVSGWIIDIFLIGLALLFCDFICYWEASIFFAVWHRLFCCIPLLSYWACGCV